MFTFTVQNCAVQSFTVEVVELCSIWCFGSRRFLFSSAEVLWYTHTLSFEPADNLQTLRANLHRICVMCFAKRLVSENYRVSTI